MKKLLEMAGIAIVLLISIAILTTCIGNATAFWNGFAEGITRVEPTAPPPTSPILPTATPTPTEVPSPWIMMEQEFVEFWENPDALYRMQRLTAIMGYAMDIAENPTRYNGEDRRIAQLIFDTAYNAHTAIYVGNDEIAERNAESLNVFFGQVEFQLASGKLTP